LVKKSTKNGAKSVGSSSAWAGSGELVISSVSGSEAASVASSGSRNEEGERNMSSKLPEKEMMQIVAVQRIPSEGTDSGSSSSQGKSSGGIRRKRKLFNPHLDFLHSLSVLEHQSPRSSTNQPSKKSLAPKVSGKHQNFISLDIKYSLLNSVHEASTLKTLQIYNVQIL
jgi:hypothetical protein